MTPLLPGEWHTKSDDEMDDLVDAWHEGKFPEGVSLREALGQTEAEHAPWVVFGRGRLNKEQQCRFVEALKKPCVFCGNVSCSCEAEED